MILLIPIAAVMAILIGLAIDRIQVGGSGIWYGNDEPPEGFVGFWDKGLTVVQWPKPTRVECIVIDGLTAEDLTVTGALYGDIVVSEINVGYLFQPKEGASQLSHSLVLSCKLAGREI